MTKAAFDNVIHAPNRLQICALLETTKELEFQIVKEQLDVSDSVPVSYTHLTLPTILLV